jgi:hypothetical protein
VDPLEVARGHSSQSYPALVGHDDGPQAAIVDPADCRRRPRYQHKLVGRLDVLASGRLDVDRAVAIEEYRAGMIYSPAQSSRSTISNSV